VSLKEGKYYVIRKHIWGNTGKSAVITRGNSASAASAHISRQQAQSRQSWKRWKGQSTQRSTIGEDSLVFAGDGVLLRSEAIHERVIVESGANRHSLCKRSIFRVAALSQLDFESVEEKKAEHI